MYETTEGGFAESVFKHDLSMVPTSTILGTFPNFKQARVIAQSTRLLLGDTRPVWLLVPLPAWASCPGGMWDTVPPQPATVSTREPRAIPLPSRDTGGGQGLPGGPAPTDSPALGPGRESHSQAADKAFPESEVSTGPSV